MRHLKTLLAVLGAATVLVLAANTVAEATTGHGFLLGRTNTATKVTTLKRTTSGPALNVRTRRSTNAPFTVNGTGRVVHLNADRVDGRDASALGTRARMWTFVGNNTGDADFVMHGMPRGTYLVSYDLLFSGFTGAAADPFRCFLRVPTASGGYSAAEAHTSKGNDIEVPLTGTGVITRSAAGDPDLYCDVPGSISWFASALQPLRIVAIPLDSVTARSTTPDGH